ncbi:KH domain containing protein [Tritrichomonas foetus]|uniref:KH domain containing protein n=1 Tax=Tritrichomonas foetus TaxID=1144522 RepID=A0A1J4K1M9_9EUKA|nr:KH domain containing protein [Tritrichomonas foetus]|eukprot:OHT05295.1 KH domain containing protein [Tritrichomonas foetus]
MVCHLLLNGFFEIGDFLLKTLPIFIFINKKTDYTLRYSKLSLIEIYVMVVKLIIGFNFCSCRKSLSSLMILICGEISVFFHDQMTQMFACPGEPDFVLYSCNGMTFRSTQSALAGSDQGFVEESAENSFQASIDVPTSIAEKVFGRKKANIQSLRRSTGTRINITEGTNIIHLIISTSSKEKLDNAVQQVQSHVDSIKADESFTHFVAVPCVSDPAFSDGVRRFLNLINTSCPLRPIAFDNLKRLHFTLLTLRLTSPELVEKAGKIICQTVKGFEWTGDKSIEISGLNVFDGGEDGPRLFYAQPRGTDTKILIKLLQEAMAAALRQGGIDVVEVIDVLHITVLRRTWVVSGNWGGHNQLEMAAEFQLPPAPVGEIALCQRYEWETGQFYVKCAKQNLKTREANDKYD